MIKALATKNVAAVLLTAAMVLGFAFTFATPAKADTLSDLQAQVQALLAQIAALQGSSSTGSTSASCFTFTQNLKPGVTHSEVMQMQKFLNSHGFAVGTSGAGSPGNETSYYGSKTKAAVMKFQEAYASDILTPVGLTMGNGNWFSMTRAKANALCVGGTTGGTTTGGTTTGGTTTTGGAVSVMAAAQPANSLAPAGAIRVPFTTFTLTNNSSAAVTINGVTVRRTGLGQDAAFAGIVLVDQNGLQVGIAKTLNSNHEATVGDSWTLQPGQSQTLTVAGNMASSLTSYSGQVVSLEVTGIGTTATVSGSLPITGASQTLNSTLSIGAVTAAISSFDPNSAQSKNIGDTSVKFTGIRFTAGSAEDLKLYSIRWRLNGTVSPSDLANITTIVNGTSYTTTVSADGRYYTTTFAGGLLIQKGLSLDSYIQGDIIGSNASGRTVQFDIDKQSDVYFVGQLFGYGIQMPYGSGTISTAATHGTTYASSGNPIFQGSTFSVTGASATSVAKATEVAAQNIAVNVPSQVLGGYVVDLKGENVSVQSHVFTIATTSGFGTSQITNITIVDANGAVVAGPVDSAAAGGTVTFTDTVTYKTGRHVYTIKGKLPSAAATGATVILSFTPSTAWTSSTGQTTGNSFTWPSTAVTMNTMTVRAASVTLSLSTTPTAQNIVAGGQSILFANVQLDASQSGEDVRVSTVKLNASSTTNTWTRITSCQLFDGATAVNTGSNVPTLATATTTVNTFTFDNSIVVTKGTVKTLALKCNVASNASGTYGFGLISGTTYASSDTVATGFTSGNTLTTASGATVTAGTSGGMTVTTGSLAVSKDSSSPAYKVVAAGATGVTVGAFKFRPTNEGVWLNKLGLSLTNTASSSAADLGTVYLYQGTTMIGTATFTGSNTIATSTMIDLDPITIGTQVPLLAKDVDTVITVKADLAAQGTSQPGVPGHLIAIDYNSADATGQDSGVNIQGSGSTAVAGVRVFKSYPTFDYTATGATASNGVNDLLVLSVTAPSSGPIKLNKLSFTIGTTTATLTSPTFTGPNGSVGTVALNGAGTAITATFDSGSNTADAEVAAGTTKTYTLRGTVSLTGSNTTGSVSTALKADTAYPSLAGFMTDASTLSASNMIWSPQSTTSPAAAGNDWTNGYGLGGCFTTSGIGNDCTARVIAK